MDSPAPRSSVSSPPVGPSPEGLSRTDLIARLLDGQQLPKLSPEEAERIAARLLEDRGRHDGISYEDLIDLPDPRFFRLALDRVGASAATTIHVGDLYHVDVVGARAAGIRPVLLDVADLYPDADCERVRSLSALLAVLI